MNAPVKQLGLIATDAMAAADEQWEIPNQTFEEKLEVGINTIRNLFRDPSKRCLISSSFGKDSSSVLNIVLLAALAHREAGEVVPRLYVINSDTELENPRVSNYAKREIQKLKNWAIEHDFDIQVDVVTPGLLAHNLSAIIGGRLIASMPDSNMKCSIEMKVTPIQKHIKAIRQQEKGDGRECVSLIGTRFSESDKRMRSMLHRCENSLMPVRDSNGFLMLSPIASWSLNDVYTMLGRVRSGALRTYSDFEELTEVYRDSESGACMVMAFYDGDRHGEQRGCSARHGCFTCQAVHKDRSLENMIENEDNAYMRPLNALRNFIRETHYDPTKRNWMSRSINSDGTVSLAPNTYSPDHVLELLRICLSIDADEHEAAYQLGIEPRFMILSLQNLLAIQVQWLRYGLHEGLKVFEEVLKVQNGARYHIPSVGHVHTKLPSYRVTSVVLGDEFIGDDYLKLASGSFRSVAGEVAGISPIVKSSSKNGERYFYDCATSNAFNVDFEGAADWFTYCMEEDVGRDYLNASDALTRLLSYGFIELGSGSHSEYDRMLARANKIKELGLQPYLNDPAKLAEMLGTKIKGQASLSL
ncbi:phosphoadenosine phosphosulfate reductase family protein [uncultured Umboniibacter sp.]|uniref:phosphoadenosine phosphosulfate reductase domain-containing protein n=1 Tax=uncultured Umboniibacter sp. TaxID=1798917 RepID=UPI00260200A2|nr:phosphoadenosine phosphosulfate reductase family protein [uncultured Umboniibacter sp.]